MKQLRNYGDERQVAFCVYCAGVTETRDHVPSKVFLDEPYPPNLPVVYACEACNQNFSKDEQYLACLVECTLVGSVNPDDIQRDKVRRILRENPTLASRLIQARQETLFGGVSLTIEADRVRNVALKLARGHAAFQLNEPQFDDPSSLTIVRLALMTIEERERFETPPASAIWPEVGSRAMQRIVTGQSDWIVVQPRRYRYLTSVENGIIVQIVLSEFLGCEVSWQ